MNILEYATLKKLLGKGGGDSGFVICDNSKPFSSNAIRDIEELKISYPNATSVEESAFSGCENLVAIDLPKATSIGVQAFYGCKSLKTFILRTTETVCVIDLSAFDSSGFLQNLQGTNNGYIYVPAVMYEYYRAGYEQPLASVLGAGAFDRIVRKIEDYPEICNGTSTGGATAHHLKSIDELPTNVVDGSIAIVDTPHPILGTWRFNSVIPEMPYKNWTMTFECDGTTYSGLAGYGSITYMTPTDDSISVYNDRWVDEKYKTITITKTAGIDETLVAWLTKNAARIETAISHAIYYRENGEWVYKGTTSEAISAEYY